MENINEYPGFDKPPVQFDCPRPYCDDVMLIHIGSIHPAPESDGLALSLVYKCLDRECGNIDKSSPAISEEEKEHLLSFWDRRKEFFWKKDGFIEQYTSDNRIRDIEQRLNNLGYM